MLPYTRSARPTLSVVLVCLGLAACGSKSSTGDSTKPAEAAANLTLGGYTTPREAYGEILPAFRNHWSKEHPAGVEFKESYLGSGAQARAIIGGFEADIAALSLEPDIETIKK